MCRFFQFIWIKRLNGFLKVYKSVLVAAQEPMFMIFKIRLSNRLVTQIKRNAFHPWINTIESYKLFLQAVSRHFYVVRVQFNPYADSIELLTYSKCGSTT